MWTTTRHDALHDARCKTPPGDHPGAPEPTGPRAPSAAWGKVGWAAAAAVSLLLAGVGMTQMLSAAAPLARAMWQGTAEVTTGPARPPSAPAPAPPEQLASVETIDEQRLLAVRNHRPPRTVVLDMLALESREAALDLVHVRLRQDDIAQELHCWLRTPVGPAAELNDMVRALSREGCTTLRVAVVLDPSMPASEADRPGRVAALGAHGTDSAGGADSAHGTDGAHGAHGARSSPHGRQMASAGR
jgi:hypothetical protein